MRNEELNFKQYFLSLINEYNWNIINPNYIIGVYDNNNYYIMEFNLKNNHFWLSETLIWLKLKTKFGFDNEIIFLVRNILEEYFKINNISIY